MDAQEMQRIYLLKSSGLKELLADINSITEAFQASSTAKAELAGNKGIFDERQLATVNKQLEMMLDIQGELLSVMKGLNPEFSKSAPAFINMAKGAEDAADGISNLSGAAKSLGSNLSGVAPALLKVQSTLNTGKIEDYDAAINKLVADLVVMQQLKAESAEAYNAGGSVEDVDKLSRFNSRMSKLGFTIEDNQVFAGSAKIPELTAEYENLKASITDTTISYEAYLKEQLEINAGISQLTAAIRLLNNTNNPSVPIDNALAYKQQADAMLLAAKGSNDLLQGQIELDSVQADINEKRKIAAYYLSGQAEADEAALLQKQILFGEAWVADLDKQNAALERRAALLRANQELKGEAYAGLMDEDQQKRDAMLAGHEPSVKAGRKVDMQEERNEVEMLKNKTILLNENASYYQRLTAQVNTAKMTLRLLSDEEIKNTAIMGPMIARVQKLDAEIKDFDKAMGNSQRNVGNYGLSIAGVGDVATMFTRQLARGVGSLIIWGLLFDALGKVKDKFMELIPGTDEFIAHEEKLEQANEGLIKSFDDLADALAKIELSEREQDIISLIANINGNITLSNIDAAKALEAKAKLNDKENSSAQAQFAAARARREQEMKDINNQIDIYKKLSTALDNIYKVRISDNDPMAGFSNSQKSDAIMNNAKNALKAYAISDDFYKEFKASIDKALKDGADVSDELSIIMKDLNIKEYALIKDREAIKQQTPDDLVKQHNIAYDKNVELETQLLQLQETYRQIKEHREVESADKIVRDISAKYSLMYLAIEKQRDKFIKDFTGSKTDPEYIKVLDNFRSTLASDRASEVGTKNNALSDYIQKMIDEVTKQEVIGRGLKAAEGQHSAKLLGESSDFGVADYDRMRQVVDAKKEADLVTAKDQYLAQYKMYGDNKAKTNELAELYNKQNEQIEAEHYKNVLAIGTQYFHKLTELTDAQTANLISAQDTYTMQRINKVLAGHGWNKDARIEKIEKQGIIYDANDIIAAGKITLPQAQAARKEAADNLGVVGAEVDAAKITGDKDKIASAVDREHQAQLAYNKALADQLLLESKITKAEHDKLVAGQKDTKIAKEVANGLLQIGQTLADSYMALLEKQDAYRQEMAKRAMAWNEMVMRSEVQSDNQKFAQERATVLAQQQLQRDAAIKEKQRAESKLEISAAIATGKNIAENLPEDEPKFAIDEGVILAELGIGLAMLQKAPAYAQGTGAGRHPGGLAWVGDGGEHEIIISPNKPTLMNLPSGSQVIPMSQLGNLGADLKAPRFTSTASYGGGSGSSGSAVDHAAAFAEIHATLHTITKGLANIQVNYSAKAAQKAGLKASFGTRNI